MLALPNDLIGMPLLGVRALVLEFKDEASCPMREAISLDFDGISIIIKAISETSELAVSTGRFEKEALIDLSDECSVDDYSIIDITNDEPFADFKGASLRSWWEMRNNQGYDDGFAIAFHPNCGLCFIGMNTDVSVLVIRGEQMS